MGNRWFYEDKLRNTVRKDPLLDYLTVHGDRLGYQQDPKHYGSNYDARMEFSNFIQNNRIPFVSRIWKTWMQRLQANPSIFVPQSQVIDRSTIPPEIQALQIVHVGNNHRASSPSFNQKHDEETRMAMMMGIPIIHNPVLLIPDKRWACAPDFFIRSDIVPLLFEKIDARYQQEIHKGAPKIGLINCHYVVVQARFISLHFTGSESINDFTLRNVGNILLYKTMAYYQNIMLAHVQGMRPTWAFLVGRSCQWKNTEYALEEATTPSLGNKKSSTQKETEEEVGSEQQAPESDIPTQAEEDIEIDVEMEMDVEFIEDADSGSAKHALYTAGHIVCIEQSAVEMKQEKCMVKASQYIDRAIQWWNFLYSADAYLLNADMDNLSIQLLPNMKNMESFPWQFVKKRLAKQHGEITQVWQLGCSFREKCIHHNVLSLFDPRLRDLVLRYMKPSKRQDTVLKIISAQQQGLMMITSVHPKREDIQLNIHDWRRQRRLEWYFDFETTESLYEDFSLFPHKTKRSFIAMIGCALRLPDTHKIVYKDFVVKHLQAEEERRIIQDWFRYCREVGAKYGAPDIEDMNTTAFVHWSQAECKFLYTNANSAKARHVDMGAQTWPCLPMLDMLDLVREEPICVKDSYSFKLKSVTKALHKARLIDIDWPSGCQCDSGLNAMTALFLCDLDATAQHKHMTDMTMMKDIIKYNQVDCESMLHIMEYLRGISFPSSDEN